jgi:hypothetical protein
MEDIDVNFRVLDSIYNFNMVMPVVYYLSRYVESECITEDIINQVIQETKCMIETECSQKGLSDEDTVNELRSNGCFGSIDEIRRNIILNVNCILLRQKRGIFNLTPYLLGAIITNNAILNGCSVEDMLRLSERLSNVSDVTEVMRMVGIDVNKYGFCSTEGVSR